MLPLPVDEVIPQVRAALGTSRSLVLTAPPGAGKSTRVPPAVLADVPGRVYLLQPRRIAAKALARRMAQEQGWNLGREVGYRVRFERVGGPETRLWVMTEGTLTRQLAEDPYLDGVSAVILDEFHERSLHTDLALAYLRDLQATVRDDLRLVVMSATLDAAPVARFLGDCPVVESPGRLFPVTTRHWMGPQEQPLAERVARAVGEELAHPDSGDVLVFLPGAGEIRSCERALEGVDALVLPLHGGLPPDEQDRALAPAERRKVVLATNVAETSVTIPGVRCVIDSGQARTLYVNPATGLDELRLEPISRASATQRAGRAGRTGPGRNVRLWTPLAETRMPLTGLPEIRRVDLAPFLPVVKRLGYADARVFPWFEAPEPARLAGAEELLALLGLVTSPWTALSPLGERLAALPLHPRLARLMHAAALAQCPTTGAALAALLGERDVRTPRRANDPPADPGPCDALDRLERLEIATRSRFAPHLRDAGIDPGAAQQVVRARDEVLTSFRGAAHGWSMAGRERDADAALLCRLLLTAYPDRVARRSAGDANRAALSGGVTVEIDPGCALHAGRGQERPPLFVAIELQEVVRGGKPVTLVRQAAEIDEALLTQVVPDGIRRVEALAYDAERGRVVSSIRWLYRELCLREAAGQPAQAAAASTCLAEALLPRAREIVCGGDATAGWMMRLAWLRQQMPDLNLPEFSDTDCVEVLRELAAGCSTLAEIQAKNPGDWLKARLDYAQQQALDEHAPAHLTVPTGNHIRLEYSLDRPPILAVRLQELFGLPATPRLARGKVPVLLHLLAPNYRPEQITQDLASFWINTYPQVRKDLRSRYPKHSWPDDPLTAPPVAKGRPRQ